jgi:hypothetical protein
MILYGSDDKPVVSRSDMGYLREPVVLVNKYRTNTGFVPNWTSAKNPTKPVAKGKKKGGR